MISCLGAVISHIIIGLGNSFDLAWMEIIGLVLFVITFSIGLGPVTWLLCSEILPLTIRAKGMTLSCSLNRFIGGLIGVSFLTVSNALTMSGTFYLLAVISFLYLIFVFKYIPETKGKKLEEMESYFNDLVDGNNKVNKN